jgi:UDP-N-acetylmuramoylalanine--D-glutamate ligase
MGLGLSGGGLETAKFLLERGAHVTVTDLKTESALAPSVSELKRFAAEGGYPPVRFALGGHEMRDFETADMVIKNPIVHPDSPYLLCAKRVESDIGLFLAECPARITAVTGSKGKSTVTAAIHFVLDRLYTAQPGRKAYLGGNSARSPLAFAGLLTPHDDVTLELSSWQLGDLRGKTGPDGALLLKPRVAVITAIMSDHQNWYHGMEPYVADKRMIFAGQDENDATITLDDDWGRRFLSETRAKKISTAVLPPELQMMRPKIPGAHQRQNLMLSRLALRELPGGGGE